MISAEILTIGDELLRGELVDTNGPWLARRLEQMGTQVIGLHTCGDALEGLVAAIEEAIRRSELLIITGGLGPTDDDRTTAAVARAADRELLLDREILDHLRDHFARAGYPFTPNNEKQARFPRGATVLPNDRGTAPGFFLRVNDTGIFCLPGVPSEMKIMFDTQVIPLMQAEGIAATVQPQVRVLRAFGMGESQMDHRLADLLEDLDLDGPCSASVHYRTSFPENSVILVVRPASSQATDRARALLDRLEQRVRQRLGQAIFAVGDTSFSEAVVNALRDVKATVALAESCTGGLAGDLITRAPGSSEVFHLGVVAYANRFKHEILGVPQQVLEEHGAVSRQCVEAMARGVRDLASSTFGVAISGVAGPGGGTPEKPVGTVHFALASDGGEVRHVQRLFPFDRQRIKLVSAYVALTLVLRRIGRSLPEGDADLFEGRWASTRSDS